MGGALPSTDTLVRIKILALPVISDIHALIRHGAAPQHRFGLRAATTSDGAAYWLIGN